MLKDLFSAVQKAMSDRVRDPLLGTYLGFFVLWNWKPITLLFFGSFGGFEDRIRYVQDLYHFPKADLSGEYGPLAGGPWNWSGWCWSMLWNYGMPLWWTMGYLLVYPIFKRIAVIWWQKQETKTINAKRERERSIALTDVESARLQRDLDRLRDELAQAQRGKYSLEQVNYWVRDAAAKRWGGETNDYAITFATALERPLIQAGHWLVHDPQSNDAWFYNRRWQKHWQACLVVALLDGPLLLVRKSGKVDWAIWKARTHTEISAKTWYAFDQEHPGRIHPATKLEASAWEEPREPLTQAMALRGKRVKQACAGFADADDQIEIEVPQ